MATGVKPRDEESSLTRTDLEAIQDAMKNKKFRDLLSDYCDEIRDPANQAIYQKEMTQLEKERGYDVTFINPKGGYVIKTSVAGDRKAFINICSSEKVDKPSCAIQEVNGKRGMNWKIPYTIIPPREDFDHKRQRCVIYDVVFHTDTLRMAEVNKRFRELVNNTAFEGLQKTYNINFDNNNLRFPKSFYKGMATPAVVRKEDPNYKAPIDDNEQEIAPDILEKLYPQHIYPEAKDPVEDQHKKVQEQHRKKAKDSKNNFSHSTDSGYTVPKYVIKQQKNVDMQEFTYDKSSKQYSAIPSHIVIEINLPLLSSTKDCVLDVREKSLSLISEKPAKYKLDVILPYPVNDECGNAKFDKSTHVLIVTLPVIRKEESLDKEVSLRADSGVDSEENSNSEEEMKENLIQVISSNPVISSATVEKHQDFNSENAFLIPTLSYTLPSYTYNVLDDIVAFTFHVKNTEPDSVTVKNDDNNIFIKFSSLGSGFVPVHYAAIIQFSENVKFENISGEAWDNNVILQLEVSGTMADKFKIGLNEKDMKLEYLDVSQIKKVDAVPVAISESDNATPVVEVTNLGMETNIVVSSNLNKDNADDDTENERDIVWTESSTVQNGAKSILRKPIMMRSFSESSVGDVASSMDYISSDCIPEESSLKKTVRFNDIIARQFYRYNSSIEGQKKKNQRKKSKKRSQDRRRSESEAEDDISNLVKPSKPRLKSVLKQRHDSGLADTSDAEEGKNILSDSDLQYNSNTDENANENCASSPRKDVYLNIINNNSEDKTEAWSSDMSPNKTNIKGINKGVTVTCDNIQHNTSLYNPDKLNKGQYAEVKFKNDLIFDLDM